MSETLVIALIAAAPGIITALISLNNGRKSNVIHALVNSQLTAVKSDLVAALLKITELQDLIVKLQNKIASTP